MFYVDDSVELITQDINFLRSAKRLNFPPPFSLSTAVLIFAFAMQEELDNNVRKGNSFLNTTPAELLKRLKEEVAELEIAVANNELGEITGEAADVANFAMFIAWRVKNDGC